MSAETVHRNHHESHIAFGTSGHTHHRRILERGGQRVAFWSCERNGWGPCPDEPDPEARLLVKLATKTADAARLAEARPEPGDPCPNGHDAEWRRPRSGNTTYCLLCHRERERRRMARVASRIVAAALAA
jgi:hypothetical protein